VARRRSTTSLPSYRAVPTRERIETTHREIIAAAVHAFRIHGYAVTKMSTVAAIAGVSPRTLYRYFGSKSELFSATVVESIEIFNGQLSELILNSPLRDAIIGAVEHADIEMNGESREMMRLAAADEAAWRYFLGATNRLQPTLAAALRSTTERQQPAEAAPEVPLFWDVRASALLGAITTAYRRWATTPGSELLSLIATAVDAVLPVVTSPQRDSSPTDVFPCHHSGIQLH
jgi:AcrR family transcriptional regulator